MKLGRTHKRIRTKKQASPECVKEIFGAATACFTPTACRTHHHHKIKSRTCRLQQSAAALLQTPIIAFQSKLKTCLDFKQVFGTRQHHVLTLLAIDHYYNEQKHAQRSIVDKLEEQHMSKGNNFLIQEEWKLPIFWCVSHLHIRLGLDKIRICALVAKNLLQHFFN